jgi:RNA recognition motif-containing protein
MNQRLYVGNLSPGVTEIDLQRLFSRVGAVTEVQLVLDPTTRQSRGYAFVTMATPELAVAAVRDFHSYSLGERYITVTEARPPQEPKGLMSEGFDLVSPAPFRPRVPRQTPRRSTRFSRRRGRDR